MFYAKFEKFSGIDILRHRLISFVPVYDFNGEGNKARVLLAHKGVVKEFDDESVLEKYGGFRKICREKEVSEHTVIRYFELLGENEDGTICFRNYTEHYSYWLHSEE